MKEEVLLVGKSHALVGIITNASNERKNYNLPAILLLNAGLLHRVGPNRMSVKIARDLAALGFTVLRFDFSGIGDSLVSSSNLSFKKRWMNEAQEAIDHLHATRGVERFVLIGLCAGALASFKSACFDSRVVGAVLINGQGHLHDDDNDELNTLIVRRTQARYKLRIGLSGSLKKKIWLKVLTGKVNYWAIAKNQFKSLLVRKEDIRVELDGIQQELDRLNERGVQLLHICSEGDSGLDYLHLVLGDSMEKWIKCGRLNVQIIPGANHTLTLLENQQHLLNILHQWAENSLMPQH